MYYGEPADVEIGWHITFDVLDTVDRRTSTFGPSGFTAIKLRFDSHGPGINIHDKLIRYKYGNFQTVSCTCPPLLDGTDRGVILNLPHHAGHSVNVVAATQQRPTTTSVAGLVKWKTEMPRAVTKQNILYGRE
jgi:hypothetical protein